MKKPMCLDLRILYIREMAMYNYWYDYTKLKYRNMTKLCYTYTGKLPGTYQTRRYLCSPCRRCFRPLPTGKTKTLWTNEG